MSTLTAATRNPLAAAYISTVTATVRSTVQRICTDEIAEEVERASADSSATGWKMTDILVELLCDVACLCSALQSVLNVKYSADLSTTANDGRNGSPSPSGQGYSQGRTYHDRDSFVSAYYACITSSSLVARTGVGAANLCGAPSPLHPRLLKEDIDTSIVNLHAALYAILSFSKKCFPVSLDGILPLPNGILKSLPNDLREEFGGRFDQGTHSSIAAATQSTGGDDDDAWKEREMALMEKVASFTVMAERLLSGEPVPITTMWIQVLNW
jgi:hypothetical protein